MICIWQACPNALMTATDVDARTQRTSSVICEVPAGGPLLMRPLLLAGYVLCPLRGRVVPQCPVDGTGRSMLASTGAIWPVS